MDEVEARAVLGVSRDASYADIKSSYKALVKLMHPDLAAKDSESQKRATVAMSRLNEAWQEIQSLESLNRLGAMKSSYPGSPSERFTDQGRPGYRATKADECEICGSWPATFVKVTSVSTFWIFFKRFKYEGSLCKFCGLAMSRYFLRETMIKGWWGLGLLFLPGAILRSISAEKRLNSIGEPTYRDSLIVTTRQFPMLVQVHPIKDPFPLVASVAALLLFAWVFISDSGTSTTSAQNAPSVASSTSAEDMLTSRENERYKLGNCFATETVDGEATANLVPCSSPRADLVSLGIALFESSCDVETLYTITLESTRIVCLKDR